MALSGSILIEQEAVTSMNLGLKHVARTPNSTDQLIVIALVKLVSKILDINIHTVRVSFSGHIPHMLC